MSKQIKKAMLCLAAMSCNFASPGHKACPVGFKKSFAIAYLLKAISGYGYAPNSASVYTTSSPLNRTSTMTMTTTQICPILFTAGELAKMNPSLSAINASTIIISDYVYTLLNVNVSQSVFNLCAANNVSLAVNTQLSANVPLLNYLVNLCMIRLNSIVKEIDSLSVECVANVNMTLPSPITNKTPSSCPLPYSANSSQLAIYGNASTNSNKSLNILTMAQSIVYPQLLSLLMANNIDLYRALQKYCFPLLIASDAGMDATSLPEDLEGACADTIEYFIGLNGHYKVVTCARNVYSVQVSKQYTTTTTSTTDQVRVASGSRVINPARMPILLMMLAASFDA